MMQSEKAGSMNGWNRLFYQLYLLQLFSFSQTKESQLDLQNVLQSYYRAKVAKRADELWDKLDLDQQKLDEMCSIHERLPYQ